jgi:hypothetical protein
LLESWLNGIKFRRPSSDVEANPSSSATTPAITGMIVIHAGYFPACNHSIFSSWGPVQTTILFSDGLANRTKPVPMTGGGES